MGNLKILIGQENGGTMDSTPMGAHHAPFMQKWICRMVMWILHNGLEIIIGLSLHGMSLILIGSSHSGKGDVYSKVEWTSGHFVIKILSFAMYNSVCQNSR